MNTSLSFAIFWQYIGLSAVLKLYLISIAVLAAGLLYEVWTRSIKLKFVESMALSSVERTHPQLPSLTVVASIFLCSVSLLIVALQTITGLVPFDQPTMWITLGAFFIVMNAVGLLAETRVRGGSNYMFAYIIGTALAFIFLVLRTTIASGEHIDSALFLLLTLALCIALAWRMLAKSWTKQIRTIALVSFLLGIAFAFLQ